ncbi:MAG: mannosyl-oligosaccharide 1,2-alpha-mannosidase IB [Benniella sp.]|nr:MAG: mannosyl-oligosaccharide 1,2-alpha-mannosidase IB [Benniella sp.]
MEPTSIRDSSSLAIDLEKGQPSSDPYGPPGTSSKPSGSVPPSGHGVSLFASLRRLFDRNPSAVVSGRYTINFRQVLILIAILTSLVVLWVVSTTNSLEMEPNQNAGLQDHVQPPETPPARAVSPPYTPSPGENPETGRERYDRVRGKGTRTSLKPIQFPFLAESKEERLKREKRLKAVRDGFAHAWSGYKKHAWGHDEVRPVTGGFKDNFNGWGATMVDSLDTLVIMGFNKEFDEALEWVKTSFDMTTNPTAQLQFFETIIRYLGGFLSAYDLTGEKVLLDKAEELGGYMLNAFQNRNFPAGRVAVQESANHNAAYNFVLAEIGTIQLEFSRLSMLTGKPIYDQKAQRIFQVLGTANSELPGLLPSYVYDRENQQYTSFRATVGGMVDSYYEYLLKEWILLDGKAPQYRKTFEQAVDSMEKYMVMKPDNGSKDYAIMGEVSSSTKTVEPTMEHLACFIAGSLAMGSKYFDRPKDMVLAKQVAEGCYLGYHHSATGIGPEAMKFDKGSGDKTFVAQKDTFFSRTISRSEYILRPETLESLWVLYRLTGDKKYQDQAWEIFQSLEKSCRTDIAYSGLSDVSRPGSHDDKMESFFLAETMKYLYLIFSLPDVISLDNFVLNTEAHPIRRT